MSNAKRYEGKGVDGRRFVAYAPTCRGALKKLMVMGVRSVKRIPPPDQERQKPLIDNRRAPGS
jgi:hypothetical protein